MASPSQIPPPTRDRQARIRELLFEKREVSISQLARLLNVSEMTVRRDLERLERCGEVRRTRGAAVLDDRMVFEFDFRGRRECEHAAKMAIAREARRLVEPGQRLLIDTGTTTLELAALLRDCEGLTVITPSLAVVSELQFCDAVEVLLLGGAIRAGSADLTGPLTEHCLDVLAADIAFQGADAIDLDGSIYNVDLVLAQVDRRMRERAGRTWILADSTKIGGTALARNGSLMETDGLITDDRISSTHRQALEDLGVALKCAPAGGRR